MAAGNNFAFKIAAKPLQMVTIAWQFMGNRHHPIQRYHRRIPPPRSTV